jgi:predicted PurR-regulated permease PerM
MLAMLLALLANPLVTRLRKIWIPRWLGSMLVVVGALVMTVWLSSLLIGPAADWVKQARPNCASWRRRSRRSRARSSRRTRPRPRS